MINHGYSTTYYHTFKDDSNTTIKKFIQLFLKSILPAFVCGLGPLVLSHHFFGKTLPQVSSEKSPLFSQGSPWIDTIPNSDAFKSVSTSSSSGHKGRNERVTLLRSVRNKTWALFQLLHEKY